MSPNSAMSEYYLSSVFTPSTSSSLMLEILPFRQLPTVMV